MNDSRLPKATPAPAPAFPAAAFSLPTLIKLPKTFPPERVLSDPTDMRLKLEDYFSLLPPGHPPTPPGLAMALGLRNFDAVLLILQREEADPGTYQEAALDVLHVARSYIEDYYVTHGLREALPAQFTKFLLSAYFNRSEKTIQETLGKVDNNIQINILGCSTPLNLDRSHNTPDSSPGASLSNDNDLNHPTLPEGIDVHIEGIQTLLEHSTSTLEIDDI